MSTRIDGGNGGLVANEVYMMVRQLCHETERESRDTERSEAKEELALGMDQARHMRDAANEILRGAEWAGATLAVSGVAQGLCLDGVLNTGHGGGPTVAQQALERIAKLADQAAPLVNQAYQSVSKMYEADAQSDAALAKAAGHEADEASDALKSARELETSATESYKEIVRSKHDSVMATLANRG
jgi:hypothetical protein